MNLSMSCFLEEMPVDAVVPASSRDETKTRMISISLTGSIVTGLGETYITIYILLFKVVQSTLIFFGGIVSLSE